jgi:hopanoid biosynthesis associated RND transporter like protein HpnN
MRRVESALTASARAILRHRKLVIVLAGLLSAWSAYYAATRLGINTDTANMISPELQWRQDFNEYRESFAARDRNMVVVVDAPSEAVADAFSTKLVAHLEQRPDLFHTIFAARSDEFFQRNGLLYSSVADLEKLDDQLARAQPLLGLLKEKLDGAAVIDVVGRTIGAAADGGAVQPVAATLFGEVTAAVDGVVGVARADTAGERHAVAWRRLISGDAAEATTRRIVQLQPVLDFNSMQPAAVPMRELHSLIDTLTVGQFRDVTARVTGSDAMEHEEMRSAQQGASFAGVASFILVTCLLYATLRSWKLLAISVVTLGAGLLGAAAFAAAAVGHLNLLSVAFAVTYIGLGTDYIIHVCLRVKELLAAGWDRDDAIAQTVGGIGSSLVISAVTTAAGFYAFIPTAFSGVAELGLISGTGMFISLLASLTLLPALLGQFLTSADRHIRPALLGTRPISALTARPAIVLAVTAAIVIISFAALPKAQFDSDPIHMRDPRSESVRALRALAADGSAELYDIVAVAPDHATALQWAEAVRPLDTVRSVTTIDSLVPAHQDEKLAILEDIGLVMGPGFADLDRAPPDPARLEHALAGLRKTLENAPGESSQSGSSPADPMPAARRLDRAVGTLLGTLRGADAARRDRALAGLDADIVGNLPLELERLETALEAQPFGRSALPDALKQRYLGANGKELIEVAPREDVTNNAAAERFVESVRSIVPKATGLPVVYQEAARTVVDAFQLALVYALVMITALLWIFLRSPKDLLLVIGPILLATGATLGITVLLGIPLNFASIIGLPLLVGIGVDNGIHILHRTRTEPTAEGSSFGTSTSLAVLSSNLTTVVSFGTLGLSAHRGMASLGQLLTLGIIMTLAASMLLLPSLLKLRIFQ